MPLLRDILRDGTRVVHERLEARFAVTDPDLTVVGYRRILAALRGWYAPLERRLAEVPVALPATERTGWLDADLRALDVPEAALAEIPECEALPALESTSDVFGCRYVIEGASLGGAVIARRLRARFGDAPGLRFFTGHGPETGPRWRAFVDALESAPLDPARALDAAVATFTSMEGWLAARGVLTRGAS